MERCSNCHAAIIIDKDGNKRCSNNYMYCDYSDIMNTVINILKQHSKNYIDMSYTSMFLENQADQFLNDTKTLRELVIANDKKLAEFKVLTGFSLIKFLELYKAGKLIIESRF